MFVKSISFLLAFLLLFVFVKMVTIAAVMIENLPFLLMAGGAGDFDGRYRFRYNFRHDWHSSFLLVIGGMGDLED